LSSSMDRKQALRMWSLVYGKENRGTTEDFDRMALGATLGVSVALAEFLQQLEVLRVVVVLSRRRCREGHRSIVQHVGRVATISGAFCSN
jgi:hypothetical protein